MTSPNRSPTPTHSEDSHGKTSTAEHTPAKEAKDEQHLEVYETNIQCTVTIDYLKNRSSITAWLTLSVLAAALGSSFVFGYNIGCINVAGAKIQRWIAESQNFAANASLTASDKEYLDSLNEKDSNRLTLIWSLVGGLFPLGAMFGGLSVGFVADKFGRKLMPVTGRALLGTIKKPG
uniref:Major facilitator superfamily (MFS) profile domain-containing protein n=1 Tax=Romanomermis culicivorax TaxID=13658 RepID=A0A915L1T5_ROMCU